MASLREEPLLRTGGSVSTTLFSLARLLGLGPITLIGQDLAYTDNQTHVEGTHLFQKWEQQAVGEQVLAYDRQGTVVAPRNLLLYKSGLKNKPKCTMKHFTIRQAVAPTSKGSHIFH